MIARKGTETCCQLYKPNTFVLYVLTELYSIVNLYTKGDVSHLDTNYCITRGLEWKGVVTFPTFRLLR
jgi:hypothetical protein